MAHLSGMTISAHDGAQPTFNCGMEAVLDLVGGKWKLLILYHIYPKRRRFGDLRRHVGAVSEKMLSQQLKELVTDGLVRRIDFQTVPPHVEYELTDLGLGLCQSLQAVCEWGTTNMDAIAGIAMARDAPREADVGR